MLRIETCKDYQLNADNMIMSDAHKNSKNRVDTGARSYAGFRQINGKHPLRDALPNGFVDYPVKTRQGGEVFYFNFELAKEMGLIPNTHPHELNKSLCKTILDTFSLEVINEYDVMHNIKTPRKDIRKNKYMATRYLQTQHPDKKGNSSGDGRSIWNGVFVNKKIKNNNAQHVTWDISSCGTGATCLSPATAIEKRFFKTGDKNVSYGGGRSDFLDGVSGAVLSEIFHRNDVISERTLGIIAFNDNTSINIRVSRNLFRPAHIFSHLKQNNLQELKAAVDYYINRQINNGDWPELPENKKRYQYFLQRVATSFGRAAARFESEYIFCWMDWDGDNILVDGGLIDFGSVRQFGLFHNEYRYDDVDRYSTTISEQKNKAKYIVQTFAQITDYLVTGKKKPINYFRNDPSLKIFTQLFERNKNELLMYKTGFNNETIRMIMNDRHSAALIKSFSHFCAYFEKAKSSKGLYKIQDGITRDAIFCLRDILRELPVLMLEDKNTFLPPGQFINIIKSQYASKQDLKLTSWRKDKIRKFQNIYKDLLNRAAKLSGKSLDELLCEIVERTKLINRYQRVTGDAVIYVAASLIRNRHKLSSEELYNVFSAFVGEQVLIPENVVDFSKSIDKVANPNSKKVYEKILKIVKECREGI